MHHRIAVDIEAPPERVWDVLVDVERWPEWTASVTSVRRLGEEELRVGSEARVKQPRLHDATWRVTALEPGVDFTWESAGAGYRIIGGHRVERRGEQGSTVTLTIDQRGIVGALVWPLVAGTTRRYMAVEAAGLKRRCEA